MARDLSVRLGSLDLPNPLIAASGCFGYGLEYEHVADLSALGGVCVKGLFMTEREGHAPPRIVETPAGMINAIGLQGIGVHRFVQEKLPLLRERGARVFVNVCGTTIDEYVEVAQVLSDAERRGGHRAEYLVSEHQGRRHPVRVQPRRHRAVVAPPYSKATSFPVIPKLTPNVTDVASFARAAEDAGADAVSLVNTFLAMAIDVETRRPTFINVLGGLSGPAIRPIAVRMVWECSREVKIPIIGMGGIAERGTPSSSSSPAPPRCRSARPTSSIRSCGRRCSTGLEDYLQRHRIDRICRPDRGVRRPPRQAGARVNRILVALDVESRARALALADTAARVASPASRSASSSSLRKGPHIVRALDRARRPRVPGPQVPRHPQHRGRRRRARPRPRAPGWSTCTPPAGRAMMRGGGRCSARGGEKTAAPAAAGDRRDGAHQHRRGRARARWARRGRSWIRSSTLRRSRKLPGSMASWRLPRRLPQSGRRAARSSTS